MAVHPGMEKLVEQAEEAASEPAARVSASKLFRYSAYVHVGEGAEECPTAMAIAADEAVIPECEDPEHFHAWVRLPNPYQHEDIRKRALAAKARRIRSLRDPESDSSVVLDQDLADLGDPAFVDMIIDEMVAREWPEDYLQAQADVEEREEYEHIAHDREEFNRLRAVEEELPDEEQSEDYKQLGAHMGAYVDALRDRLLEIQQPKRDELRERSIESLIALVRSKRVDEEADSEFMEVYSAWSWFVGTFKVQPHETLRRPHLAMWEDIGHKDRPAMGTMLGESTEVLQALKRVFNELSIALQQGSSGN